ncbi:MAG: hypothetical protein KF805_13420 [Phycisphaeraceae bacterium]|nr:hypothetical protein [Phycisphaeraceae bacterium]
MLRTRVVATLFASAGAASVAFAQSWAAPVDGSWSDPAKWFPQVVPSGAVDAILPFAAPYTVTMPLGYSISTLDILNSNATLNIQNGAGFILSTSAPLHNNGTIVINSNSGGAGTSLSLSHSSQMLISGSGQIVLNATANSLDRAYIQLSGAPVASTNTIRGSGNLYGQWVNDGIVQADSSGLILQFASNVSHANNSIIKGIAGGILTFVGGNITQGANGRLIADGGTLNLNGSTVNNGTVEALNAGLVGINGSVHWNNVLPIGPMAVPNSANLYIDTPGLTHDDTFTINPTGGANGTSMQFTAGGTFGGTGTTILNATGNSLDRAYLVASNTPVTIGASRTIRGSGNLYGTWSNSGTISPGLTNGAIGTIGVRTGLTLTDSSMVEIDVVGDAAGQFDLLGGGAAITLDGSLIIDTTAWSPTDTCANVGFVTGSAINGVFDSYTIFSGPVPAGKVWRLDYQSNKVSLRLTCNADQNGDCFVDDADFTYFLVGYNILDCADPSMPQYCPSDLNFDGVVDDADFVIFVVAYNELLCP